MDWIGTKNSLKDADESLAIDNELLCEIEAESWVNGTRGILVESRAPALPRLEQNCSLLPVPPNDRVGKAAKAAAAAAAIESEGRDALYSMPWQKLQVRDAQYRRVYMVYCVFSCAEKVETRLKPARHGNLNGTHTNTQKGP